MLTQKYRPKDWPEIVGQDKACKLLARREAAGELRGHAYWVSGKSGVGKTSIARIIRDKVSDPMYSVELDASELTMGLLRDIKEDLMYAPMTCDSRVYIINEAHGLRKDPVRMLLQLLEEPWLSPCVTWIFTTTLDGQMEFEDSHIDSSPLLSRCTDIKLHERGLRSPMALRCQQIARAEGMDGQPIEAYERLMKRCTNNMRTALQEIEAGIMKASQ